MQDKTTPDGSGKLVRRLALAAALGGTVYLALGLAQPAVHSAAFVSGAASRTSAEAEDSPPESTTSTTAPQPQEGSHIAARVRLAAPVAAKKQDWTPVTLIDNTWTQGANDLQLIAGTVRLTIPAKCTGSFGNALTLMVDDAPITFATAPTEPAGTTMTLPFLVGTLSEPGQEATHTMTAKFGSSCTQEGEEFKVEEIKVDVLTFG